MRFFGRSEGLLEEIERGAAAAKLAATLENGGSTNGSRCIWGFVCCLLTSCGGRTDLTDLSATGVIERERVEPKAPPPVVPTCPDADGDGHASVECGGDDCN